MEKEAESLEESRWKFLMQLRVPQIAADMRSLLTYRRVLEFATIVFAGLTVSNLHPAPDSPPIILPILGIPIQGIYVPLVLACILSTTYIMTLIASRQYFGLNDTISEDARALHSYAINGNLPNNEKPRRQARCLYLFYAPSGFTAHSVQGI